MAKVINGAESIGRHVKKYTRLLPHSTYKKDTADQLLKNESIKHVEKSTREHLHNLGLSKDFLHRT